ncbi:MAG: beta-glucosidase [Spirochaetes bacterium]|nr:beta-glucosidase [Spirochaetota bacterium]MBU0956651.1 beta-glucosidase [Spirochaetota bacterium]
MALLESRLKSPDFLWGVSSSAYQIEGSVLADGRGESIWDSFCRLPGKVKNGDTGAYGSDSYVRWQEDVDMLHELGAGAYRFSIAWPRIKPDGSGAVNHRGFGYYHRLIEELLAKDIEPWVALYHWDLPQALQDRGGWLNRDTAFYFADYAELCFREFGGLVKNWVTLNEPWCSAFLGHGVGVHAPGLVDVQAPFTAAHHLLLAHGLAVKECRELLPAARIGIVLNPWTPRSATARDEDKQAALLASVERTGLWCDPLFNGQYPEAYCEAAGAKLPILPGDMALIKAPLDFLGINYYNEDAVCAAPAQAAGYKNVPTWQKKTEMQWDIVPDGLVRVLSFMSEHWKVPEYYITENGAAFSDSDTDGKVIHDNDRIEYLQDHVLAVQKACELGLPVKGYFVWTMLDNFEWSHGYEKRFGMVAIKQPEGERIRKSSFYFYRDLIAGY